MENENLVFKALEILHMQLGKDWVRSIDLRVNNYIRMFIKSHQCVSSRADDRGFILIFNLAQ